MVKGLGVVVYLFERVFSLPSKVILIFISVSRCGYLELDKKENSAKSLGV